jgi:hypothetical protein
MLDLEFMKDDELRIFILNKLKKQQIKDIQELMIDLENLNKEELLEVAISEV